MCIKRVNGGYLNHCVKGNSMSFLNSHRQPFNGYFLGALLSFNPLYFLITLIVLPKTRLSRLTCDLPHSLFGLNGLLIPSHIELRTAVNTKSKEQNHKWDKSIKPSH